MADTKYIDFIEKVITKTKENDLEWAYLDTEPDLCKAMNWLPASTSAPWFLQPNANFLSTLCKDAESFVCKYRSTFIVLLVNSDSSLPIMFVIPKEYKGIVQLLPGEYGEYTTRLHNLIKKRFPHGDQFIDDFLTEE